MCEEAFFRRLRQVSERFVNYEVAWDELWRTFCFGFYTDEMPEGDLSGPVADFWAEIYEMVYMSQPGMPAPEDRALGLQGEDELREVLAWQLARTVAKGPP
jgi:hypothetical protein